MSWFDVTNHENNTTLLTIDFKISPCNVVFNLNPLSETPNQIILAPFSLFSGNGVWTLLFIVNPFQKLNKEYFYIKN